MKYNILSSSIFAITVVLAACNKKIDNAPPKLPEASTANTPIQNNDSAAIPICPPADQWNLSSSLVDFKNKLLVDLESGDQRAVLSAFADNIEFTPGNEKGPAGVLKIFGLDGSTEKTTSLKPMFTALLENGGCMIQMEDKDDSSFHAPAYNCYPESKGAHCGERGCGVVGASPPRLIAEANIHSDEVGQLLPFEIVSIISDTLCEADFSNCKWTKVKRANGVEGYLPGNTAKSKWDGFVKLMKGPTGWRIQALRYPGVPWDDV